MPNSHRRLHVELAAACFLHDLLETFFIVLASVVQHSFQFDRSGGFWWPCYSKDKNRGIDTVGKGQRHVHCLVGLRRSIVTNQYFSEIWIMSSTRHVSS